MEAFFLSHYRGKLTWANHSEIAYDEGDQSSSIDENDDCSDYEDKILDESDVGSDYEEGSDND